MSQAVATQPQSRPPATLAEYLNDPATTERFALQLPENIPSKRFVQIIKDALNKTPALRKCSMMSIMNACARAATDGLVLDGHEAALVPYGSDATYVPMVFGLRKLIYQSGMVSTLETAVVYAKEYEEGRFDYEAGTSGFLKHKPILVGERGDPVLAYSIATMKDGTKSIEVMRWDEYLRIASKNPLSKQHPGEWARKTVTRRHAKTLPMSPRAESAFEHMDELYTNEAGETQPGEISEPQGGRKQAGGAAAALAARRQAEEPAHDPETGEIDDPESGGPTDAQFDPI